MRSTSKPAWLGLGVAVLAAGCGSTVRLDRSGLPPELVAAPVELTATAFYPQSDYLCGPAALATVLDAAGVEVTLEEVTPQVYLPERRGSLQLELVAAIRSHGRLPYPIQGNVADLLAELHAGYPVLVLQNLGVRLVPIWHYAVVVGFLPAEDRFVLRSGERRRHLMSSTDFLTSWQRGGNWGIVAVRPGELPATAAPAPYLRSAAALEAIGQYEAAVRAYQGALERWPENTMVLLGLGNALYGTGDLPAAESAYRRVLELEPTHVIALNNLAQTLSDQQCYGEAADTIDLALAQVGEEGAVLQSLTLTRDRIRSERLGSEVRVCHPAG